MKSLGIQQLGFGAREKWRAIGHGSSIKVGTKTMTKSSTPGDCSIVFGLDSTSPVW